MEKPKRFIYHRAASSFTTSLRQNQLIKHWVTIEDSSWANNLTRVGRLLEQCDYQMEA